MNQELQVLLMLRGLLAELPDEARAQVRECQDRVREVMAMYGDLGKFDVGLIGAELAAEAD